MYFETLGCNIFIENTAYTKRELCMESSIVEKILMQGLLSQYFQYYKFDYVGIIIVNNIINVVMPKGFCFISMSRECVLRDIRSIILSLTRYRQETNLDIEESFLVGGDNLSENGGLFSAYKLIEDYKRNGYLKREIKNKTYRTNNNIDWNNTVKKKSPIFSQNGIIYDEHITSRKSNDTKNILISLHKYALNLVTKNYGWIFQLDNSLIDDSIAEIPCPYDLAIFILEKELTITYINREVEVIKYILSILQQTFSEMYTERVEVFATKKYYHVWEKMCSSIFNNQYNQLKIALPQPKWEFYIERSESNISQIPDIISVNKSNLFVIDAKYYDIKYSVPGWKDVVKQFYYALSIKEFLIMNRNDINNIQAKKNYADLLGVDHIYNLFIVPTFDDNKIMKVGKVNVKDINKFGHVDLVTIPFRQVVDSYLSEVRIDYFELLEKLNLESIY